MKNLLFPLVGVLAFGTSASLSAQDSIRTPAHAREHGLESLRTILIREGRPSPDNRGDFIQNNTTAHQLGKALFYDMAVGSDGIQSCGTCHFHAGADSRSKNQLSPGLLRVEDDRNGDIMGYADAAADPDTRFERGSPNSELTLSDFPFVRDIGDGDNVAHVGDTVEPVRPNRNDVVSSQGVTLNQFLATLPGDRVDVGLPIPDDVFNVNWINTRRVEPRNTPTVINAVFNFANFWDGRADNCFNGVDPFGDQSCDAEVWCNEDGVLEQVDFGAYNSSLASQASGPPLSDFEMSFRGRVFADIGRKMLSLQPLGGQEVAVDDSTLASLRHPSGKGLTPTYEWLIKSAFLPKFWNSDKMIWYRGPGDVVLVDPWDVTDPKNTYTQMEANFSLFFGIAVQAYESLLISDLTPFDRWMRSNGRRPVPGFGVAELRGLNVFVNEGHCIACHAGPELTGASVRNAQAENNVIEAMLMADGEPALYDNGFYNIAVTPTTDDLGRGGNDPWGAPLSYSRSFMYEALGIQSIDELTGSPICLEEDPNDSSILGFFEEGVEDPDFFPVCIDDNENGKCDPTDTILIDRVAVDGAFKTPGLRNVELTGPYMHNGAFATLLEVVEFYDRGGNYCRTNRDDLDPDIRPLGLTRQQKSDLVSFMISLTDPRVKSKSAPFDAPELLVPNGHKWNGADQFIHIPATGKKGVPAGEQLKPFLNANHFTHGRVVGGECSPGFDEE